MSVGRYKKRKLVTVYEYDRIKIKLVEGNAKCRHKKKLKRYFAAGVYLSEAQKHIPPTHTVYLYTVYLFTRG